MIRHMLCLDYDNVTADFVIKELFLLKQKYGIELTLSISSRNHYHIQSANPIEEKLAFRILNDSRCSQAYKDYCHKVERFPARISEKIHHKANGDKVITPPPRKVFKV